ncbi:MAG: hypothetical protein GY803_12430 [Chloroflexi bacterium]|nr:hypothetical protein [Chloroflexota bacterium]
MNPWVAFVIGLLVGWLAEWIIDWLFWRRKDEAVDPEWQTKLNNAEGRVLDLERQLQEALSREPEVVVKEVAVIKEKDRLERINGIGKVFAARFNEAGVYTFADLAALSAERAHEIINPEEWQAIEPDEWIAEAAQFAASRGKD